MRSRTARALGRCAIAPWLRTKIRRNPNIARKGCCNLGRQIGRSRLPAETAKHTFAVDDNPGSASGDAVVIGVLRIGVLQDFAIRNARKQTDALERRRTAQ